MLSCIPGLTDRLGFVKPSQCTGVDMTNSRGLTFMLCSTEGETEQASKASIQECSFLQLGFVG